MIINKKDLIIVLMLVLTRCNSEALDLDIINFNKNFLLKIFNIIPFLNKNS